MDLYAVEKRLVMRFGPRVRTWVDRLPERLAALAARWRLDLGTAFETGHSSVVLRCAAPDGPAVLKLSPDAAGVAEEVDVLRAFAPCGRVPAIHQHEEDAVLMEAIEPGTPVEGRPCPPVPDFAALLRELHRGDPASAPRDLAGWTDVLFDSAARRGADLRAARRLRDRLLATRPRPVLLHGDLHFGNVLDGGVRGLFAIDPMGCAGDPCFDAVDYVLAAPDRAEIVRRGDALAAEAGLDADRLDAWCRATAPIGAVSAGPAHATELLAYARGAR
ncbi:MAG: aminoglycoside phosphotransferase family protein [Sciscionella sp.]